MRFKGFIGDPEADVRFNFEFREMGYLWVRPLLFRPYAFKKEELNLVQANVFALACFKGCLQHALAIEDEFVRSNSA